MPKSKTLPKTREEKERLLLFLREKDKRKKENTIRDYVPYPWATKFSDAGLINPDTNRPSFQRLLMAANRVGKTFSVGKEFAYHATGEYPVPWAGLRFDHPLKMWALGVTGEQIRDVIQKELFGEFGNGELDGTGDIPKRCIIQESIIRSPQTKNLIKDVKIRHVSGGETQISLKAYSQGQHVLMGQGIDFIWIDEEPEDQEIYPQCVIRTATGNKGKGGYIVLSFTPENSMTPLICQFMEDIKPGQYLQNVTWDDAPHLTEEVKIQLLAAIPEYQRDMRSKGIPILGSGVIFPVADEDISCVPFECPDHWPVLNGCDFGWDHPQGHVQLWFDPDQQITYVTRGWRKAERDSDQAWGAVKNWSKGVPVAWPHDGHQHEKGGGLQLQKQYADSGFNMMASHAVWPEGGLSVEAGLWLMLQDMRDGKFKVFNTLAEWFEEKRLYHRDDKGKIVKLRDDLLSATRYGYMMRRFAVPMAGIKEMNASKYSEGAQAVGDYDPYN